MGKWYGTAPLSNRGDYSHGPKLLLKYNNGSGFSKAKLSENELETIGGAYDLAIAMLSSAINLTQEVFYDRDRSYGNNFLGNMLSDPIGKYFGDTPDVSTIFVMLLTTQRGLKNNSETNRLHIYSNGGKRGLAENVGGYVGQYDLGKKGRPQVQSYPVDSPTVGTTTLKERGHIHIKLGDDQEQMAKTIVHEATHRFAGTGDFAYYSEIEKWRSLTSCERLNNADSYAEFCSYVYTHFHL